MNGKFKLGFLTILIALSLIPLPGCSTISGDTGVGRTDRAPANLRSKCPPMAELRGKLLGGPVLEGDLVEADALLAGQYAECAERVNGWIEWEAGRGSAAPRTGSAAGGAGSSR